MKAPSHIPDGEFYLGISATEERKGEALLKIKIQKSHIVEVNIKKDPLKSIFESMCQFIISSGECCLKSDEKRADYCKYWLVPVDDKK